MKIRFDVKVPHIEEIHELPGDWSTLDKQKLLELADFEDWDKVAVNELSDYLVMTLQDLEPEEAAFLVLTYRFGDSLTKGQIQNMSHEMMSENLWEEYKDISLHKELFNCAVMLKSAFPRDFPETDALKCSIEVEVKSKSHITIDKVLLTRLLAYGLDDHSKLNRLFDEQIKEGPFAEASHIIWDFSVREAENKYFIDLFSSNYWLSDLDSVSNYEAEMILGV